MIVFISGLFLGLISGYFLCCIMISAKRSDEIIEKIMEKEMSEKKHEHGLV